MAIEKHHHKFLGNHRNHGADRRKRHWYFTAGIIQDEEATEKGGGHSYSQIEVSQSYARQKVRDQWQMRP